jgi:hypothetical protein
MFNLLLAIFIIIFILSWREKVNFIINNRSGDLEMWWGKYERTYVVIIPKFKRIDDE